MAPSAVFRLASAIVAYSVCLLDGSFLIGIALDICGGGLSGVNEDGNTDKEQYRKENFLHCDQLHLRFKDIPFTDEF
jgi:hypothetical protein